MRLPHRDPIQLGPTAYEAFQAKEGIPSVTGFFIEDLMDVEVKPWARMGASAARAKRKQLLRLVATTRSQSSGEVSSRSCQG